MVRYWLLALGMAGCLSPDLVECSDGLLCPADHLCDTTHHVCVTPDQLMACAGVDADAPCDVGGPGICRDGVCLPAVCGNGVGDPGEACDDGNTDRSDGCNADCTSTEVCGNGIVDAALDEQCDDGNLVSHDGCDSRCGPEHEEWRLEGITPFAARRGQTAYDAVRHEIVAFDAGLLWGWDGARWTLRSSSGPVLEQPAVVFDSVRGVVVVIGCAPTTPRVFDQLWEWDGQGWSQRAVGGKPAVWALATMAFVSANSSVVALGLMSNSGAPEAFSLDLATATWAETTPPVLGSTPAFLASAFDDDRGVFVVIDAFGNVFEASDVASASNWQWSQVTTTPNTEMALVYSSQHGGVLLAGGIVLPDGPETASVFLWDGTNFTALADLPDAGKDYAMACDTARLRCAVFGRTMVSSSAMLDFVTFELAGTSWSTPPPLAPTPIRFLAVYESGRDRIVYARHTTDTWLWDGAWRVVDTGPAQNARAIAYDPIRDVTVSNVNGQTFVFANDVWMPVQTSGIGNAQTLGYDAANRRLLGVNVLGLTLAMPSDGDVAWSILPGTWSATSGLRVTSAFDAHAGRMVAVDSGDGRVVEYDGSGWEATLSPGVDYSVVADTRRGTVVFVSPTGSMWERSAGSWTELPPPPIRVDSAMVVYDDKRGELVVLGTYSKSFVMYRRALTSGVATETCIDGDDADGDGLAGCSDPDCWWRCTPGCPPYTSCM